MTLTEIIAKHPPRRPISRLLWTAVVDVAEREDLGASPDGHRFLVPILGGSFFAGPDKEGLKGKVLKGGADRQILRPDGVKELDAAYEMETDSGTILAIRNRVIVDETCKPERYAMSVISVSAPVGQFDWLNRRVLIGTLDSARPDRRAVIVRAWEVDVSRG